MNEKGFTLIELMIVIAIVGILASVLIPALDPDRQTAPAKDDCSELGVC